MKTTKTSKATIAEILHLAADKHLSTGKVLAWPSYLDNGYSCWAIDLATYEMAIGEHNRLLRSMNAVQMLNRIHDGLQQLGLDADSASEFDEFRAGKQRQQARYNWLKFAALIAEEQGV